MAFIKKISVTEFTVSEFDPCFPIRELFDTGSETGGETGGGTGSGTGGETVGKTGGEKFA